MIPYSFLQQLVNSVEIVQRIVDEESYKIYDGIVETAADLTGEARLAEMSPGSLMYCLADGKVYAKNAAGEWVQAE